MLEVWLGGSTSHRDSETEARSRGCVTSDRNWPEGGQVPRMQIGNRANHQAVSVLTAKTMRRIATAERTTNRHTMAEGELPSSLVRRFFLFIQRHGSDIVH